MIASTKLRIPEFSDFWASHFVTRTFAMKLSLSCLLLFFSISFFAQSPAADSAFIRNNFTKREVMIPMRDGVKLFTSIYSPKDQSQKYPIIIRRTPYSCSPYGEGNFTTQIQNMHLVRAGYVFVFQDVRGKYMSEGEFVDVRPFNPDKKTPQDAAFSRSWGHSPRVQSQ